MNRQGDATWFDTFSGFGKREALGVSIAALLCLAAPAAQATLIKYAISPTIDLPHSAGNNVYLGDMISGTFTWNTATDSLASVGLTVTGTYLPGAYDATADTFTPVGRDTTEISSCIVGSCTASMDILHLLFQNPLLDDSADPIADVSWDAAAEAVPTNSPEAVPVPEPSGLIPLGTGFAALFLIGLRSKRRARRVRAATIFPNGGAAA